MSIRYLRAEQVAKKLSLNENYFRSEYLKKNPDFPASTAFSPKNVVWLDVEVEYWMLEQVAKARGISPDELIKQLLEKSAAVQTYENFSSELPRTSVKGSPKQALMS